MMTRIIAHRGLTDGPGGPENTIKQIDYAISLGFDIECDIWIKDTLTKKRQLFLGHNYPETEVDESFFVERGVNFWLHAKNVKALHYTNFISSLNDRFFHDNDDLTVTLKGYYWLHPDTVLRGLNSVDYTDEILLQSINVLPETSTSFSPYLITQKTPYYDRFYGICTDYPRLFKEKLEQ